MNRRVFLEVLGFHVGTGSGTTEDGEERGEGLRRKIGNASAKVEGPQGFSEQRCFDCQASRSHMGKPPTLCIVSKASGTHRCFVSE